GRQRLPCMAGRAQRVAEVVQAVEEAHEVVILAWEALGSRLPELDAVGDAGLGRVGARRGNGVAMRVEAYETRLRIGRGHDERRMAVATTYVGDPAPPLQALDDTVESGQPRRYEVCPVRRPEEGRAAAGQALVVIAPGDAFAGAKGAQHLVFVE